MRSPGKADGWKAESERLICNDKYTFVEVPREYAREVLNAMKNVKIKGKTVAVEPANQK